MKYVPLRVYSVFSRGKGAVDAGGFADFLKARNINFLSVTDPFSVVGWESFRKEAVARDMKPLLGLEIRVQHVGSLLLYPLTLAGYFSLIASFNDKVFSRTEQVAVVYIPRRTVSQRTPFFERIRQQVAPGNLYLGLEWNTNRWVADLAKDQDIPLVWVQPCKWVDNPEKYAVASAVFNHHPVSDILMGTRSGELPLYGPLSGSAISKRWGDAGNSAMKNTFTLASRLEFDFSGITSAERSTSSAPSPAGTARESEIERLPTLVFSSTPSYARTVHNLNGLYLEVKVFNIDNNNKYALRKCGKNNELTDIIDFTIPWVFHNPPFAPVNHGGKLDSFFLPFRLKLILKIEEPLLNRILKEIAMGRPKYFRTNIQDQINSLQYKSKYFYLKNINISRYGLCIAEAELLAEIANDYYQNELLEIPENCFTISLYQNFHSNKKQNLHSLPRKTVTIPAFSHYQLDIYLQYGIKALQNHRIVNILDSIASQNSKIDINLLAKIVNITPKSIRERLIPFFKMGVGFPALAYLSDKWFSKTPDTFRGFQYSRYSRYSKALKDFFIENISEEEIMRKLLISKLEWSGLLFQFFQLTYRQKSFAHLPGLLIDEISAMTKDIMITPRYIEYSGLYPRINTRKDKDPNTDTDTDTGNRGEISDPDTGDTGDTGVEAVDAVDADRKNAFINILKQYFSFPNALVCDYLSFLHKEASQANKNRKDGEIIYYAVSQDTISGTPLSNSEIVPLQLTIFSADDKNPDSPYHTSSRKWNKAQRYAIQAKNQKATLSQYDLAFLLGVSISVVKSLMKKHNGNGSGNGNGNGNGSDNEPVIPTRGNIHDIGPGISHAEKIIKLYLEGHTETEIKFKTAHSYESIENYLRKFTKVVGLTDMGLNLNQIRMSAKMTYNLAAKFREIYENYNHQEYGWIMAKIRNNFSQTVKLNKNEKEKEKENANGNENGNENENGKKKIIEMKRRT